MYRPGGVTRDFFSLLFRRQSTLQEEEEDEKPQADQTREGPRRSPTTSTLATGLDPSSSRSNPQAYRHPEQNHLKTRF
jgi:hypothetical protein